MKQDSGRFETLTVRMTKQEKEALRELADRNHRSLSGQVMIAIEEHMQKESSCESRH